MQPNGVKLGVGQLGYGEFAAINDLRGLSVQPIRQ
jgi:hypothetical protein